MLGHCTLFIILLSLIVLKFYPNLFVNLQWMSIIPMLFLAFVFSTCTDYLNEKIRILI